LVTALTLGPAAAARSAIPEAAPTATAWPGPAVALLAAHPAGLWTCWPGRPPRHQPLPPRPAHHWVPGTEGQPGLLLAAEGPAHGIPTPAWSEGDGPPCLTDGGQALLLHRPRDAAVLLTGRHDGAEWARWPCQDPTPALLDLPVRWAALVALSQTAELWEVPLDPRVEDRYEGLVHDFRMGEGVPVRAWRRPRRIPLPGPLHHPAAEPDGSGVIGWSPGLGALAFNLDTRRVAERWPVPEPVRPGDGMACSRQGRPGWLAPATGQARAWWLGAQGRAEALALPEPAALLLPGAGHTVWLAPEGPTDRLWRAPAAGSGAWEPLALPGTGRVLRLHA
jgi:hypothetical protein